MFCQSWAICWRRYCSCRCACSTGLHPNLAHPRAIGSSCFLTTLVGSGADFVSAFGGCGSCAGCAGCCSGCLRCAGFVILFSLRALELVSLCTTVTADCVVLAPFAAAPEFVLFVVCCLVWGCVSAFTVSYACRNSVERDAIFAESTLCMLAMCCLFLCRCCSRSCLTNCVWESCFCFSLAALPAFASALTKSRNRLNKLIVAGSVLGLIIICPEVRMRAMLSAIGFHVAYDVKFSSIHLLTH